VREPPSADLGIVARVRAALSEELRGGEPTTEHVAKRLAMSERTLQRRLAEIGTSYVDLLSELRRELA